MASRTPAADPYAPLPPHLDPRGRHRGRSAGGRGHRLSSLLLLGRTFLVILSVGLLLLAGYYWYTFRSINNGVPRLHAAVGAQPSGKSDIDGTDQNILLVGNDDRENMTDAEVHELHIARDGGSKATDTMMIVHVPADGSKATIISLPRDSWVSIPGSGHNRLNAAYVVGYNAAKNSGASDAGAQTAGADLLIKSVSNLTGLTINHYIQVGLLGFYEISKAIGGVTVNLCTNVDDSKARNQAAGLSGGSGFKMTKGKHTISGKTALQFVRQRHFLNGGDLDRVRRQQYFLTAAFRKVASAGLLFKLNALGNAVKRNIVLDNGLDLVDLAKQMERLQANNIIGKTIPTTPQVIDGNDVLAVDPARVQRFVDRVINPPAPAQSSSSPAPSAAKTTGASSASATPKAIDAKCIN